MWWRNTLYFKSLKTFIFSVFSKLKHNDIYLTSWSKKFTPGNVDAFYQHLILAFCHSSFFCHSVNAFTPVVCFIIISYIRLSGWRSVNALASHRCDLGSIPGVGMWDGHWSPSQASGFPPTRRPKEHRCQRAWLI